MTKARVLIVDDEEIVRLGFAKVLGDEGYTVDTASDGDEAIEKATATRYDIVFIDYVLPGMDGIAVCRAIGKVNPGAVRIFMTGKLDSQTTAQEISFKHAGGQIHYLYKPFSSKQIIQTARTVLADRDRQA